MFEPPQSHEIFPDIDRFQLPPLAACDVVLRLGNGTKDVSWEISVHTIHSLVHKTCLFRRMPMVKVATEFEDVF